ncbi:hypothetical protein ASZ90_018585 [hydrocarbon metagenome]|uniref:Uncharacterized protein n=1 Tax=hydrocarbon metagenome TaxID=938273 RepID=A0A0W8E5W4_9ZZZZ
MAKLLEKMSNYTYKVVDNETKTIPCPRNMNDVYSIGTNLQYYIGDIYLHLAELSQRDLKPQYKKMAIVELEIKQQIQEVNNARLNELLGYFYNNGGAVIEPPLTYMQSKEIQPFFTRIIDTFTSRVEDSFVLAADGSISPGRLESMINYDIIEMYTNLSKLFPVDEISKAFRQLIVIRKRNVSRGRSC